MSNSFGYDVTITPSPLPVTIELSISSSNDVSVSVTQIPDSLDFSLTPTGDFGQQIEDSILTPLIGIGHDGLVSTIKDKLNGATKDLGSIGSYTVDGVTITPSTLALTINSTATSGNMLQITGNLTLSAS